MVSTPGVDHTVCVEAWRREGRRRAPVWAGAGTAGRTARVIAGRAARVLKGCEPRARCWVATAVRRLAVFRPRLSITVLHGRRALWCARSRRPSYRGEGARARLLRPSYVARLRTVYVCDSRVRI